MLSIIILINLIVISIQLTTQQQINDKENHYDLPPIFILNLDRSKDRWQSVEEQFVSAGLTGCYERLPAVDGRALPIKELLSNSTRIAAFFQPRGVLGCYLSHRKFWQLVVDRNYSQAIVFEDDVRLADGFIHSLTNQLIELTNNRIEYDVAFLGAIGSVDPNGKDSIPLRMFSAYMGGTRPFKQINKSFYQPTKPAGTHAYMVTNAGARKLLQLCPNAVFHVDLDAWRHRSIQMILFNPMLAHQTFDSTELTDFPIHLTTSLSTHSNNYLSLSSVYEKIHRRINGIIVDKHSKQPLSHVLAEPMIQFGPGGPVLTVERHCAVVLSGCALASVLKAMGYNRYANFALSAVGSFIMSVRAVIWLLMHWR
mmetsp:Transcript_1923/g.1726  ORF Transcript_1923/g.1726 Transcript_1923/m.1726 type:complete len:368 (-) Transcript_1923:104-1207(-)